jgi:hypothetical protein
LFEIAIWATFSWYKSSIPRPRPSDSVSVFQILLKINLGFVNQYASISNLGSVETSPEFQGEIIGSCFIILLGQLGAGTVMRLKFSSLYVSI